MTKGGARVRSGPAADPKSARTERRGGANLVSLPAEARPGRAPAFPLPQIGRGSSGATKSFRARELAIWRAVWRTPQAWAWDPDSWRWPTIAEYCRIKAAVELDPDSNAALLSRLREYRNEIGLSPDGLRANGWTIAPQQTPVVETPSEAVSDDALPPLRLAAVAQ